MAAALHCIDFAAQDADLFAQDGGVATVALMVEQGDRQAACLVERSGQFG